MYAEVLSPKELFLRLNKIGKSLETPSRKCSNVELENPIAVEQRDNEEDNDDVAIIDGIQK